MTDDRNAAEKNSPDTTNSRHAEKYPLPARKPMPDNAIQTGPDLPLKVVRLREGVYTSEGAITAQTSDPVRTRHLVLPDADLDNPDGVRVCCGVWFAPGTLEVVPWGKTWPHTTCVTRSPWNRAEIELSFQKAERELPAQFSDEEFDTGFSVVEGILALRDDWAGPDESFWDYTASYNGIPASRSLRCFDLGIESLVVELSWTGMFRIWSCGVQNGCSRHASYTETYSLDEVPLIEKRLTVHETAASSIDLHTLAWCVVFGNCSQMEGDNKE